MIDLKAGKLMFAVDSLRTKCSPNIRSLNSHTSLILILQKAEETEVQGGLITGSRF